MSPESLKLFKAARHLGIWVFTLLAVGPLGLAQRGGNVHPAGAEQDWPHSRATVGGFETVLDYALSPDTRTILGTGSRSGEVLLRLPSASRQGVAELAGMLQQGADIEVFMVWQSLGPQGFDTHIEIFRGRPGTEAALVHDFTLDGGPGGGVSFFQPPDARDTPKVLIDISPGRGATYLLAPDRQSVEKLFDASGYEFADLDGDGVYELIAWDGRWSDSAWCIDLFGFDFFPRIFVRDGAGYRMAWPLPGEANFRVAAVHDLRGDGVAELIVLQDRVGTGEPTTPAVALYRLDQKVFRLVAQAPLPAGRIAFTQIGYRESIDGKEILVRTASPAAVVQPPDALARAHNTSELAQCDPQGPGATETAYISRADRLEPVQR